MDEGLDDTGPVQALLPGRRALIVRLTCKPGMRPALLDNLNTYIDGLAEEPGTEVFMMSLDPENENLVWLTEVFKDDDAVTDHRSSNGFATLIAVLEDLLAEAPAVLRLEPLRLAMQETVLEEDWAF